jgi:hypothetical protein
MAASHYRHLWQGINPGYFKVNWSAIRHDSVVLVTAAEGRTSDLVPDRFIGAAWIEVWSIAPFDGGVNFFLNWQSAFKNLNVWTDVTVFDPGDPISTD